MNRRGFLKLVAVAVAGPCLPVAYKVASNQHSGFDPTREYAHAIRSATPLTEGAWSTPAGQQLFASMKAKLKCHMEQIIPPAYRESVSWHERWADWGTMPCMLWRYSPKAVAA